jgi:predicted RND superfamily exporter protein
MKGKWYQQWWFYVLIALVFLLLGAIIFRERDRVTQEEILKTEIEDLVKQTKTLDSLYRVTAAEKEKIKVIREKIDITQDIKKLQQLIAELEGVKSEPIKRNSSTLELKQYLDTEF